MSKIYDAMQDGYEKLGDKPLICLWSGGCDSTLALHWLLQHLKKNNDPRTVMTYSFIHTQLNDCKMDAEAEARSSYSTYAKKNGLPLGLNRIISIDKHAISVGSNSCPQPALWISGIIPYIEDNSTIFLGYHAGDQFWNYDIFQHWENIAVSMASLFGKRLSYRAPLIRHDKVEIIRYLRNEQIYEHTWYCEGVCDDGKPCMYCLPCKLHKMALLYLDSEKPSTSISCTQLPVELPALNIINSDTLEVQVAQKTQIEQMVDAIAPDLDRLNVKT